MYITPFTIMDVDMYDSKMNTGPTCTKHLELRCSLSLTFNQVKIM